MVFIRPVLLVCLLASTALGQPPPMQAPPPGSQKVEIKGTIERVQAAPGEGMPYLELKGEKGVQRVMLGSMRYLMEHNFNPKAGSVAVVKGFLVNDLIIAQSVAIPAEKVTIQLRDENGLPLWRMGRYGWGKK
jgi:hypothetical protein